MVASSAGGIMVIKNEAAAWAFLERALTNELGPDFVGIELKGWPIIAITLKGDKWDSSLTAKNMAGLIEIQNLIYRALAIALYNNSSTKGLKEEEKNKVEVSFKMAEGSSLVTVNFDAALNSLVNTIGPIMTPESVVITVLGLALTGGGITLMRKWLQDRKEINLARLAAEDRQFAGEQETKRMEIFARAVEREPKVGKFKEHAEHMYSGLIKGVSEAEHISIAGHDDISGETLQVLASSARTRSIEERLDGTYRILKVDSSDPDSFKVTVLNSETLDSFPATLQNDFVIRVRKNQTLLQQAEWGRREVYLKINSRKVRGDIRSATIIGVEEIPEE